jgi:outer membrane receptor protein involved in Fe transport
LFGKEFVFESENILGINIKTSYTGGEYYIPVNLQESVLQGREMLDENDAYVHKLKDFFYVDLSATYRINYQSCSLIWALQVKNLLNQKPVIGYSYNSFLKSVEESKPLGIVPMINCKLEF